jgi:hypothetical protein
MLDFVTAELGAHRRDYLMLLLVLAFSLLANYAWMGADTVPSGPDQSIHFLRTLYYADRLEGILGGGQSIGDVAGEYQNRTSRGQNLYPPGVYATAIPAVLLLGQNYDSVVLAVNGAYFAILLLSTYWIGRKLFGNGKDGDVGVLAAALVSLFPTIFGLSREYFLEFALLAVAALNIALLLHSSRLSSRPHAILFGLVFGFGMMVKFTYPVFLLAPLCTVLWSGSISKSINYKMKILPNLLLAALMALIIMAPWYYTSFRPEFLFQSVDSYNQGTGMPPVLSVASFLYNPMGLLNTHLYLVYFAIFLAAIAATWNSKNRAILWWLLVPLIAFTLLRTKDPRFITGILPIIAVMMAGWLMRIKNQKNQKTRKIAIGLVLVWGIIIMLFASFGSSSLPEQIYIGTPDFHATVLDQPLVHNYASLALPRVALHEDWQMDAIISEMEARGLGTGSSICLVSFHPYFDIGAFKQRLFARRDGIDLPSTTIDDICNHLDRCDAVIYKDGGPELLSAQPYVASVVKPTNACLEQNAIALNFKDVRNFPLPDNSTARLYMRT